MQQKKLYMSKCILIIALVLSIGVGCKKKSVTPSTPYYSVSSASLTKARYRLAAGVLGNNVVFAGGVVPGRTYDPVVEIYTVLGDGALKRRSDYVINLAEGRSELAAAVIGSNIVFAGGDTDTGATKTIDIFELGGDDILKKVSHSLELQESRTLVGTVTIGNKIIFAGGWTNSLSSDKIDIFELGLDGKLKKVTHSLKLKEARFGTVGAVIGNKVVFAGGTKNFTYDGSNISDKVDIFELQNDGSLKEIPNTLRLSKPRFDLAATALGNKIIFAGGKDALGEDSDLIDIFELQNDGAVAKVSYTLRLSKARSALSAVTVRNRVVFAGGLFANHSTTPSTITPSDVVDIFELSNNTIQKANGFELLKLTQARYFLTGVSVNNQAIFAGGDGAGGSTSDKIDVINF